MKDEYDFSKMKSRKNPYASKLKRQLTIRLGDDVISYFKSMAEETGIPYQSLIRDQPVPARLRRSCEKARPHLARGCSLTRRISCRLTRLPLRLSPERHLSQAQLCFSAPPHSVPATRSSMGL